MFRHPAWAGGWYSSSPSARGTPQIYLNPTYYLTRLTILHSAGCSSVARSAIGGDLGQVKVGHPHCFAPIACVSLQVHQTRCNKQNSALKQAQDDQNPSSIAPTKILHPRNHQSQAKLGQDPLQLHCRRLMNIPQGTIHKGRPRPQCQLFGPPSPFVRIWERAKVLNSRNLP